MRRARWILAASVVLLAVLAAPAWGATGPADDASAGIVLAQSAEQDGAEEATSDGPGLCAALPIGPQLACEGVTTGIGAGTSGLVSSGARAALDQVVTFVVEGAGWLLGGVADLIDTTTRPEVTAGWFTDIYGRMAMIGLAGLLPFLLLALIQGLIRQDVGMLLRSTFGYVPLAAIGTGAAVVAVDMVVAVTDALSDFIGQTFGADLEAFATGLGSAVTEMPNGGAVVGLAALLGGAVVAFASFVIWLELLLRQAAIYVAVLFLPLGFMAMVWPATAHWLKRLVQGLVAIILSKLVIVAVMALAASALDAEVATEGFGTVIAGAALLSMAALAPYVLLRLIPVFEAGLVSGLEGTLRRPTAAVGTPTGRGGGGITTMLRQRLAAPSGGAGPGQPAAAVAGAGGATVGGGGSGRSGLLGAAAGRGGAASGASGASGTVAGGAAAPVAAGAAVGTAGVAAARTGARVAGTTAAQVAGGSSGSGAAAVASNAAGASPPVGSARSSSRAGPVADASGRPAVGSVGPPTGQSRPPLPPPPAAPPSGYGGSDSEDL